MAYIHIADAEGFTVDQARQVAEKVGPRPDIDGLLVEAVGSDDRGLHIVTVWRSKAHKDRYEAEQLVPVFQSLGMASEVARSTTFTTWEAEDLYLRSV
jgi:hypothetical protein